MTTPQRYVFDPLLGTLETLINENAAAILAEATEIGGALTDSIREDLPRHRSRDAQFSLIHRAINEGEILFAQICAAIPKETLMSIARRAPESFLEGADLLLATLIVKYSAPAQGESWSARVGRSHALTLAFTPELVRTVCRLTAIAKTMNHLRGMARWLGKGGQLIVDETRALRVKLPPAVTEAVSAYERRRIQGRLLDHAGFFAPQPEPKNWTQFRIPIFLGLGGGGMIEAPEGSDRRLRFERWPTMMDGGALASLLRHYDTPLQEIFGAGADPILHFLTALAVLIDDSSPAITGSEGRLAFRAAASPADTEHKIGFAFGLARKGFLRLPRQDLVSHIGRVRSPLAPDQETGEALAASFIDAFLMIPDEAKTIDAVAAGDVPFLHPSTDDHLYIDVLLLGDFLGGIIEAAKAWYASQHGDRFVLDLKRWLDEVAPGAIVAARRPITLEGGGAKGDIDLLLQHGAGPIVVECKAFAKSRPYLIGAPEAIAQRRARIRAAARQADRIARAFGRAVKSGSTGFPADAPVRWLVCTPTAEFLVPLDELGMAAPGIPRVLTPEELLELLEGKEAGAAG